MWINLAQNMSGNEDHSHISASDTDFFIPDVPQILKKTESNRKYLQKCIWEYKYNSDGFVVIQVNPWNSQKCFIRSSYGEVTTIKAYVTTGICCLCYRTSIRQLIFSSITSKCLTMTCACLFRYIIKASNQTIFQLALLNERSIDWFCSASITQETADMLACASIMN